MVLRHHSIQLYADYARVDKSMNRTLTKVRPFATDILAAQIHAHSLKKLLMRSRMIPHIGRVRQTVKVRAFAENILREK